MSGMESIALEAFTEDLRKSEVKALFLAKIAKYNLIAKKQEKRQNPVTSKNRMEFK